MVHNIFNTPEFEKDIDNLQGPYLEDKAFLGAFKSRLTIKSVFGKAENTTKKIKDRIYSVTYLDEKAVVFKVFEDGVHVSTNSYPLTLASVPFFKKLVYRGEDANFEIMNHKKLVISKMISDKKRERALLENEYYSNLVKIDMQLASFQEDLNALEGQNA